MRKTDYEGINVAADFGDAMTSSESISTYSIECIDKDGNDATDDMIENDTLAERTRITFRVKAGTTSGSPYTAHVYAGTDEDQDLEIRHQITVY